MYFQRNVWIYMSMRVLFSLYLSFSMSLSLSLLHIHIYISIFPSACTCRFISSTTDSHRLHGGYGIATRDVFVPREPKCFLFLGLDQKQMGTNSAFPGCLHRLSQLPTPLRLNVLQFTLLFSPPTYSFLNPCSPSISQVLSFLFRACV